jgi:tetratricopeptide (TPR) repeat protein
MASAAQRRWFFGPWPDLLFGCGLLYAWVFAMQTLAGPELRRAFPLELAPFLTIALGMPHYGATLLRVYERREERRRYALFALWATAAMFAAFVAGLQNRFVGSLLVTIYFTWSPWHYTGQNYGIALLFLRRRGVPVDAATKRWLWSAFVLSYALVFLTLQGAEPGTLQAPGNYVGTVFEYLTLGIPAAWRNGLAAAAAAVHAVCLVALAWRLLRAAPARDLGPAALVVLVQDLWFLLPAAATLWSELARIEPLDPTHRAYAFLWVAAGHFLQYLWITTWYSAATEGGAARARYLAKTLLAGAAVWTLPPLVFAPGLLGRLPFDMGLALLTASIVNIHHFVLDGAIWKLRDGRVARMLLRSPGGPDEPAPPAARRGRALAGRSLGWAAGALALLVATASAWEGWAGNRAFDRGDLRRVEVALARLARLGQDSPKIRTELALHALGSGSRAAAREEIERSLALYPTARGLAALGRWHEEAREWEAAARAYRRALELAPEAGDAADLRASLERAEFSAGGYGRGPRRAH